MTLHQRYCHQTATWNLYTRHALFKWAFFSFSFYFHIHLFILLHIFTSMMKSSVIHHIRGCVCSQNVNRIKRKVFSIKNIIINTFHSLSLFPFPSVWGKIILAFYIRKHSRLFFSFSSFSYHSNTHTYIYICTNSRFLFCIHIAVSERENKKKSRMRFNGVKWWL